MPKKSKWQYGRYLEASQEVGGRSEAWSLRSEVGGVGQGFEAPAAVAIAALERSVPGGCGALVAV
jgi:hypothetical protein